MNIPAINLKDGYKIDHRSQYPPETTITVNNWTPRKSRNPLITHVVKFGLQAFTKEWLIDHFNRTFFQIYKSVAVEKYKRRIENTGNKSITYDHIAALHDLQYLPLQIMALPEGARVPLNVPQFIMFSTNKKFFWLTNMLETLFSTELWKTSTSATHSFELRKLLNNWSLRTCDNDNHLPFQAWDFSARGMSGVWDGAGSGAAHLLSFQGSDTIYAIDYLENYYNADSDKELISAGIAATEHSVMSVGTGLYIKTKYDGNWEYQGEAELDLFRRLITEVYPTGGLSIVSDTWSLPKVVTKLLPKLKQEILNRDGFIVIRPDSFWTNPQDCLCGYDGNHPKMESMDDDEKKSIRLGLVESLYDLFGGSTNSKGYKLLHPKISCIYGEAMNYARIDEICERLMFKNFASSVWVGGIGSMFFNLQTRDSFGFAMKCTYAECEVDGNTICIDAFKDPITDDGTKKSAVGLTAVFKDEQGEYYMKDRATWEEIYNCELKTVFKDGKILIEHSLSEIRERLKASLSHEVPIA